MKKITVSPSRTNPLPVRNLQRAELECVTGGLGDEAKSKLQANQQSGNGSMQ